MKHTFFQQTFFGYVAVAAAVIALMSAVFFVAVRASISSWNADRKEDFETILEPVIAQSYRLAGELSPDHMERALNPYLTDSFYIYIFDMERNPVLLIEDGKRVTQQEVEAHSGALSSFIAFNPPAEIYDGTQVIAYLLVDNIDFLAYKANRIFLSTMEKALAIGGTGAILCILILSLTSASALSRKTSAISDSIVSFSPDKETPLPENTGFEEFDRITQSVQMLRQRLRAEANLRRQWMQDISHDLRTPITAVQMQLEGIADGVLQPTPERLHTLFSELKHIERLVCNLQDLSRFESPEMQITPLPVQPELFLSNLYDRFSYAAGIKQIQFSCTAQPDTQGHLPQPFNADELLLQRCVSNIIQNALQHTQEHGAVSVTLTQEGSSGARSTVIRITNTGSISESDIPHIFDRLYRGDKSRSTEGNGLGLSIAQAIVALHNGTISVRTLPKTEKDAQRVQFSVHLPA